ncbi:protein kinase domain protein [Ichthyophthirius multifiliis]|uniref:Protein kinase domain protein n=1 Tax=Ichthyophthirius multifiliis TaxID=5932 RepID=G0R4E2_ICHMU|nr:protein kinase domain protein [Ichthyophthirius multifiliis]EGR27661.1 protein kinase domain protein [Ichthyophthirius multifiliis]|eukprot:XP_004025113.1 protein kinase domain protein [Ichthyophthirius multifiliis]
MQNFENNLSFNFNDKSNVLIENNNLDVSREKFQIEKSQFNFYFIIGKGGFGKVWKVENRKSRQIFAMKEMSKSLVITKKSVSSVMNERNLLSMLKHPFLVNMQYAFQDRDNLYLVMDFMAGGDLRFHIGKQRKFNEEQTKFFVTSIFLGLEYLHKNSIIHRDIKPENIVLDGDGYVKITDLGVARIWNPDNQNDTSGTPWIYGDHMLEGLGKKQGIKFQRKKFKLKNMKYLMDGAQRQLILQIKKPAQRLGINGSDEVKNHPWIKNYPWQKLYRKELNAPFKPSQQDNFDFKQQISQDDEQDIEVIQQNAILLRKPQVQSIFLLKFIQNILNITQYIKQYRSFQRIQFRQLIIQLSYSFRIFELQFQYKQIYQYFYQQQQIKLR